MERNRAIFFDGPERCLIRTSSYDKIKLIEPSSPAPSLKPGLAYGSHPKSNSAKIVQYKLMKYYVMTDKGQRVYKLWVHTSRDDITLPEFIGFLIDCGSEKLRFVQLHI